MPNDGRGLDDCLIRLVEWVARTERILGARTLGQFCGEEIAQLAVSRCIEGLGEAANAILRHHPEFALAHPELELADVYSMRNRLVHGYESASLSTIYYAALEDVPRIGAAARQALDESLKAVNDEP